MSNFRTMIKSIYRSSEFYKLSNDSNRLFFILTDPRWIDSANFGGTPKLVRQSILSVISSGMFFVPVNEKPFPGISIFD